MKKFAFIASLVLMTSYSFSQEKAVASSSTVNLEQYESLNLTEDQTQKILQLEEGIQKKNEYVKNDPNLSADQKKEFQIKNNEAKYKYLETILTPEQYSQFKLSQKEK